MTDYAALAQQLGGNASDDYSALAKQYGGAATETVDPEAKRKAVADAMVLRGMQSGGPFGAAAPDIAFGSRQVIDALAQLASRGAEKFAPDAIKDLLKGMRIDTEATNSDAKAQYEKNYQPDAFLGAGLARGTGNAAVGAALTPALKAGGMLMSAAQGAGVGGITNALTTPVYEPGDNFGAQKLGQVKEGAATGGAFGGAFGLAGKLLAPEVGASQAALRDSGVTMTPGQVAGGMLKTLEDKATSIPILGDLINNSRFRGITDFNKAVYSKALAPFGDEGAAVVSKAEVGNRGIAAVGDFLSSKYEAALAQSNPAPVTKSFQEGINNLSEMVPTALKADFDNAITRTVLGKITPGGTLTPSVAKAADSELGRLAAAYRGSSDAAQREMSVALREAQSEVREMFAQANPETAPLIRAADAGWSTLVQMERAGSMLGAKDGIFTPSQLLNAIKRGDTSIRDRSFARGEMKNQEFAQAADEVLPSKVPDSGTVGRGLVGTLATGGAVHAFTPMSGLAIAGASLPYLPIIGPGMTMASIAKRPESVEKMGEILKMIAPYLGGLLRSSP